MIIIEYNNGDNNNDTHNCRRSITTIRGWEGKTECSLCGNECENVSHVLWECSVYSTTRASFMKKLQELLEDDYEDFELLENVEELSLTKASNPSNLLSHSSLPSTKLCARQ